MRRGGGNKSPVLAPGLISLVSFLPPNRRLWNSHLRPFINSPNQSVLIRPSVRPSLCGSLMSQKTRDEEMLWMWLSRRIIEWHGAHCLPAMIKVISAVAVWTAPQQNIHLITVRPPTRRHLSFRFNLVSVSWPARVQFIYPDHNFVVAPANFLPPQGDGAAHIRDKHRITSL